jgi:hypothetical protein
MGRMNGGKREWGPRGLQIRSETTEIVAAEARRAASRPTRLDKSRNPAGSRRTTGLRVTALGAGARGEADAAGWASRPYQRMGRRERNVPFYQTNPPILSRETAFINQRYNGLQDKIVLENGGFVFGNEPTGPPSRGRYGATRPTRRGVWRGCWMKIGCVLAGNGWTRWTGMDVADRVRRVPPRRDGCIARGMGTNNSRKRQRSLDKSRNPAGSRRMTGLGMTGRGEGFL